MTKIHRPATALVAAALLGAAAGLAACDQADAQSSFELDARAAPSGITRTTAAGEVTSRDEGDWRVAPVFATRLSVQPLYPNPLPRTALGRLAVTIYESEGVPTNLVLYRVVPGGALVLLDTEPTPLPGSYLLDVTAAQLGAAGLHRLLVVDRFGQIVTYGDVEVP